MTVSELPPRAEVLGLLRTGVLPAAGAAAGAYLVALVLLGRVPRDGEVEPDEPDVGRFGRALERAVVARNIHASSASVIAIVAALFAGNVGRVVFPWWPDGRWWHWAGPPLAVAVVVTSLVSAFASRSRVSGEWWGLATTVTWAALFLVFAVVATAPDNRGPWVVALAAYMMLTAWLLGIAAEVATDGRLTTVGMSLIALGGSAVLFHHKTLGFAELLSVTGVALATLFVLGLATRSNPGLGAAVAVVPLVMLLSLGHGLADSTIPVWVFLLIGGLPLVLLARMPPYREPRWWPFALCGLVVAGVAVAVIAAMQYEPLRFGDDW